MKREKLYLQKNYLKEIITNDFRYIGEIRSIKPINHNDINSKNFLVECKKSKYVLKWGCGEKYFCCASYSPIFA